MINLMIVDDEPLERKGLEYLISKNYKDRIKIVKSLANGQAAVEAFESEKVHFILMDIQMPIKDGIEAAREIKEKDSEVQIIVLTAFDEFEYAKKAIHIGVNDYLLKPISNNELYEAIDNVVGRINKIRSRESDLLENELVIEKLINLNENIQIISDLIMNKKLGESLSHFRTMINILRNNNISSENIVMSLRVMLKSILQNLSLHLVDFDMDTELKSLSVALNKDDAYEYVLRQFLEKIMLKIDITRDRSDRIILMAKEYMKEHFDEEISLEEISAYVEINPYYFSKLFKKIEGKNFKDYLIELRMDIAKDLLKTTNLTIKEIAYKVGYSDANYFSRAFKRYTGISATKYF